MALIELHPDVQDYIVQLRLAEIRERGGIADLVEEGKLVIISDLRLEVDFATVERLAKSTDLIDDANLRRQLKKLEATSFFEGSKPRPAWRKARFDHPVKEALYQTICHGDSKLFDRAATTFRRAHEQAVDVYTACFPGYRSYRLIPSVRLTQTLFENLHWDEHRIEGDFHTARVFANLDTRPRIWHLSHSFPEFVRLLYEEHNLGRFAGDDPNELLSYINGEVLGGLKEKWKDRLPRHRIAFEPGEIWVAESRLLSHQIYYGEAALVYMWLVDPSSMANQDMRFNRQIEQIHAELSASPASETQAI